MSLPARTATLQVATALFLIVLTISIAHAGANWWFRGYKAEDAASLCGALVSTPLFATCSTSTIHTVFLDEIQPVNSAATPRVDCRMQVRNCDGASFPPPKPTYVRILRLGSCDPHEAEDSRTGECLSPPPPDCTNGTGAPQGNPIDAATGLKLQVETDFAMSGASPLAFVRSYRGGYSSGDWTHGFQSRARYTEYLPRVGSGDGGVDFARLVIDRPGRGAEHFTNDDLQGVWVANSHTRATVENIEDAVGNVIGWRYTSGEDTVDDYDVEGRLVARTYRNGTSLAFSYVDALGDSIESDRLDSITDSFGNRLSFAYAGDGGLSGMIDPAGARYHYAYDAHGMLETVTYPDDDDDPTNNPVRRYHYELPGRPWALTGISDERGIRLATYAYDNEGRGVMSEHAGGANRVDISYPTADTAVVTNSLGRDTVYRFQQIGNARKLTRVEGIATANCLGTVEQMTYDANGYPDIVTDASGYRTDFDYNPRGLIERRTDAVGTAEARVTTTEWHPTLRIPTRIVEAGIETRYSHDADGNPLTVTRTDLATGESRVVRRTFNRFGQVLTIDGPRTAVSDVTRYTYHDCASGGACGQVATITNALGHVTEITGYNAAGQPTHITDANGIETVLAYDARNRLISSTVDGAYVTRIEYDPAGQVTRIAAPNGSYIDYQYDAAARLVAIGDAHGNRIENTVDSEGNHIRVDVRDASGFLRKTRDAIFDELSRVLQTVGESGQAQQYTYDLNGNPVSITEANAFVTTHQYDALNRLIQEVDAMGGVTRYRYDDRDRIETVTDPEGLTTRYIYNGFGDRVQRDSPDSGITDYAVDEAGNVLTTTDARGVTARYTHDALNRVTAISYPDGAGDLRFAYDQGVNGVGRLSRMQDASGYTDYAYDSRGNLIHQDRVIDGVSYSIDYGYDESGNLQSITYPSGIIVSYTRDVSGRVTRIDALIDGERRTLVSAIDYLPFGPLRAMVHGNGLQHSRDFDTAYRLQSLVTPGIRWLGYSHDPAGNIDAISDALDPSRDQGFHYNPLGHLTGANGLYGVLSYSYDGIGNRLTGGHEGGVDQYHYQPLSSRLTEIAGTSNVSFVLDAAGSTIAREDLVFGYDNRRRLETVSRGATTLARYAYNGEGQRVAKIVDEAATHFIHDASGRLLAEAEGGAVIREYVWLDQRPIAVLDPGTTPHGGRWSLAGEGQVKVDVDTTSRAVSVILPDGSREEVVFPSTRWYWHEQTPTGLFNTSNQVNPEATSGWLIANAWYATGGSISLGLRLVDGAISGVLRRVKPPPYLAVHSAILASGSLEAVTTDAHTGDEVRWSIDPATRSLSIHAHPELTGSWIIPATNWVEHVSSYRQIRLFSLPVGAEHHVTGMFFEGYGTRFAYIQVRRGQWDLLWSRLNGNLPVDSSPAITHLHTDHLGTPRIATDPTGTVIWRWVSDPFGLGLPEEDPDADGKKFTLNLRFPGQYFDGETGLHYNYYRYYDPSTGRYITSDPIGLEGGLNTYAYVHNNPINMIDPKGLQGVPGFMGGGGLGGLPIKWPSSVSEPSDYDPTGSCRIKCGIDFVNPIPNGIIGNLVQSNYGELAGDVTRKITKVTGAYDLASCLRKCNEDDNHQCEQ